MKDPIPTKLSKRELLDLLMAIEEGSTFGGDGYPPPMVKAHVFLAGAIRVQQQSGRLDDMRISQRMLEAVKKRRAEVDAHYA